VSGGYYDAGIVDGRNKIVPSITFRIKKSTEDSLRPLSVNSSFKQLPKPGPAAPGSRRERLRRSVQAERPVRRQPDGPADGARDRGYTGDPPQSRADILKHSQFQDMRVHVFAKHSSSQWVEIAQFDVPRRSSRSSVASEPPSHLERRLGALDAAAIVVSNVIGGGIFFVPIIVAQLVPIPGAMLGGVGRRRRAARSPARWRTRSSRRCGRTPAASTSTCATRSAAVAAFLTGWTSFIAGLLRRDRGSAVALADYVTRFVPAPRARSRRSRSTAIAALTLCTCAASDRAARAEPARRLKVGGIVLIVALRLSIGMASRANLSAPARRRCRGCSRSCR
jgi:hypothetical protein